MSIFRKISLFGVGFSLIVVSLGCGSASNNDQGTSFLHLGYFADETGDTGQTGALVPLFTDRPQLTVVTTNGLTLAADGAGVIVAAGLQNRLSQQFIRLVRMDCDYTIPGSNLRIPSDSDNIPGVLGPTDSDEGVVGDAGNVSFVDFFIVSTDIFSFLNVNQSSLPKLPFTMIAECRAVGVTQAGDTLTTNTVPFPIDFFDTAECCTGTGTDGAGGFQVGPGTGGDVTIGSGIESDVVDTDEAEEEEPLSDE